MKRIDEVEQKVSKAIMQMHTAMKEHRNATEKARKELRQLINHVDQKVNHLRTVLKPELERYDKICALQEKIAAAEDEGSPEEVTKLKKQLTNLKRQ